MVLICNQHLFEKAKRINLPTYIQTEGFSRRFWYPAMRQILGKGTGKEIIKQGASHRLADKSISDVCEALIGAAIIDKGLDGATKMVTSILQTPDHQQMEWADYYKGYTKPVYQLALPSASQIKLAADIEKQIGYRFKSPRLLVSAFTHSSNPYSWEKVPCYQRLEFLGDALLDLVCVRYIFDKHPEADPQWLTEHKAIEYPRCLSIAMLILILFRWPWSPISSWALFQCSWDSIENSRESVNNWISPSGIMKRRSWKLKKMPTAQSISGLLSARHRRHFLIS